MIDYSTIKLIVFFILLIVVAYTDLKEGKIRNWVTIPGILLAFWINYQTHQTKGVIESFLGCITGFLPFYLIYRLKGLGAGDVKLISMIGSFYGAVYTLHTLWYASIIGFFLSIILLIKHHRLKIGFKNYLKIALSFFRFKFNQGALKSGKDAIVIPYGLAIVMGAYLTFFRLNLKLF